MLTKLILKNYIPLKKKGIEYVELNTNSIFNIILGRNGYGKTSILRELNPFPPENINYHEDGYKEVHYKIKNKVFVLISNTGKKSSHEFWYNGKNLNEGATLLVQRDLVKQYFGISTDVRNVLTGIDRSDCFSALPPQKRKSVLMEINPNDTSYGVKVYDKARVALNQTKGALKHQRQRLVLEEKRQTELKSMNLNELHSEIARLDGIIKDALLLHGSLQDIEDPEIKPIVDKMSDIMSQLLSKDPRIKFTATYYHTVINRSKYLISQDIERLNGYQALMSNITEKINNFDIPEGLDLKGFEDKILECTESIKRIQTRKADLLKVISKSEFFKIEDWNQDDFKLDIEQFLTYIRNVEVSEDKNLSSQGYIKYRETLKELENLRESIQKEYDNNLHILKHFNNADLIECPDCHKKFKVGFENVKPEKLKEINDRLLESLEDTNKKIKDTSDILERNEGWFETMNSLMRFVRYSKSNKYLLEIIKYFDVGKVDQNILPNLLKSMMEYYKEDKNEEENIVKQTTLKAQYQLMNESNISALNSEYDEYSKALGYIQKRIRIRNKDIEGWNEKLDIIKADELLVEVYCNLLDDFIDLLEQKGKYRIKTRVTEILSTLTPQKEKLITDLIRSESLSSIIDSIKENISELDRREKHLKAIVDGLSPVKGMIGSLMIDFLNLLTANVNAAIEPIWTDQLKLLACHIEEDGDKIDLDYKFPVLTGYGKEPNEDIKKCSGGEKEIIDFMMRKILHRYKGEDCGIPLIMDEVGTTFDELHRGRFASYITEQLRLDLLPQTFMISHYVNQYGALNTRDVNVIGLNTKGLSVPEDMNLNSIIR